MRNDIEIIDIKDWSGIELVNYLQDNQFDTDQYFIDFKKQSLEINMVIYQEK